MERVGSAVDPVPGLASAPGRGAAELGGVLAGELVRSVYQPIVDLESAAVVGYEALARGPVGPLRNPAALLAAARAEGLLAELDDLCRRAALRGAARAGITGPQTLFVNVEPEGIRPAALDDLLVRSADAGLPLVLEVTERSLAANPAQLLATLARLRHAGWRVALDDVGVDDSTVGFMSVLRPDIVKLDLGLVHRRPGARTAAVHSAVQAYAERHGAVVLAEGIETEEHLSMARSLGATLGQGWLFGQPADTAIRGLVPGVLALPAAASPLPLTGSPFDCLPEGTPLRTADKRLLVEISRYLEEQAAGLGAAGILVSTFQERVHFDSDTADRYRDLAAAGPYVAAVHEPRPDGRLRREWAVAVLSPHFAAALLGRDHAGEQGGNDAGAARLFDYAITHDRDAVAAAVHLLMTRLVPVRPDGTGHLVDLFREGSAMTGDDVPRQRSSRVAAGRP
ncbi:sensor domain-containing phosphodiesterase [Nakamurella endophytica]|uniref:EAL domain-containing protein n=1 Tax=Nakamurella endophytica TaxID=1748367 RepID=A0A917WED7_9ACTN|nr:EAL domain-containing protein [Nakamurella endophytica]GGL99638.1 hypothetical protein GCM10011594_19480 [Nakamurella endophytica]